MQLPEFNIFRMLVSKTFNIIWLNPLLSLGNQLAIKLIKNMFLNSVANGNLSSSAHVIAGVPVY